MAVLGLTGCVVTGPLFSLDELADAQRIVSRSVLVTPQLCWPLLCEAVGAEVWVKHENHTPIGAFKVRGGLVYLHRLSHEPTPPAGVVTATRGNHGQSMAYAVRATGTRAVVVVPEGNNPEKDAADEGARPPAPAPGRRGTQWRQRRRVNARDGAGRPDTRS